MQKGKATCRYAGNAKHACMEVSECNALLEYRYTLAGKSQMCQDTDPWAICAVLLCAVLHNLLAMISPAPKPFAMMVDLTTNMCNAADLTKHVCNAANSAQGDRKRDCVTVRQQLTVYSCGPSRICRTPQWPPLLARTAEQHPPGSVQEHSGIGAPHSVRG